MGKVEMLEGLVAPCVTVRHADKDDAVIGQPLAQPGERGDRLAQMLQHVVGGDDVEAAGGQLDLAPGSRHDLDAVGLPGVPGEALAGLDAEHVMAMPPHQVEELAGA